MPFTWKKVWIWVSLETTRWEKNLPIQYRFPRTDNTFSDKATIEQDSWVVDTILDSINSQITKQRSEWTIWGQVYPNWIWFFLKALLWNVTSNWDNWIYEHTFTLLESNTHPTLTVWTSTPISSNAYPLAMIESMDFTAEVWWKFTVSINLKAKKWEQSTHTVTYTDENGFIANMLKIFLADTQEWLDIADNICLQSITISIKKEIKDIECLSSIDPIDYINSSFSIEWSMEMLFEDNTYKDYFLNWTPKALRLLAEDTKHPYSPLHYPTFMLDLAKIKITDRTPAFTIDDVTKQSITFKWHYDVKTKKAIEIYLKNTQESYWWEYIPPEPTPEPEPQWEILYTSEEVYNQETWRYEYHITRTQWNTIKLINIYQNYSPTNQELSRSIVREITENWNTSTSESNSQVNILTRNRIVNEQINANDFWEENRNFLYSFNLDTSYIHYYILKIDDYNYLLGSKYLNEEELFNTYPFTISHDNTLIKHGYNWDEIIAWWQEAINMINYIHNHENSNLDNDNFEAELRELNRYSYSMNCNLLENWWEYYIQANYSWTQQIYIIRNDNWNYSVINQTTQDEWAISSNTWDNIETNFALYREENWFNEDANRIRITNTQYNELMLLLWGSDITEDTYEWTDESL